MEQLSEHEIAQQRVEKLQNRRTRLGIWIALIMVLSMSLLVFGIQSGMFTILLIIGIFIFAGLDAIELYFGSPRRAPPGEVIEQELDWLYGDDWQEHVGVPEYMRAQERVRRRGINRWHFFLHIFVFLLANVVLFEIQGLYIRPSTYLLVYFLAFEILWLAILMRQGFMAFPSPYRLMLREKHIGQAMRDEIQSSQPDVLKWKGKPKWDVLYRVGEDGELVEVEDEFTFDEDEKAKRDTL